MLVRFGSSNCSLTFSSTEGESDEEALKKIFMRFEYVIEKDASFFLQVKDKIGAEICGPHSFAEL